MTADPFDGTDQEVIARFPEVATAVLTAPGAVHRVTVDDVAVRLPTSFHVVALALLYAVKIDPVCRQRWNADLAAADQPSLATIRTLGSRGMRLWRKAVELEVARHA